MLNRRLQILVTEEQRGRLEAEAERRQTSVGALVREAVDTSYGTVSPQDRLRAVERIGQLRGRFLAPDQLNRVIDEERDLGSAPSRRAAPGSKRS
ncbi:MAG: hypothetical protein ACR2G3_07600 [Solirubrobacterales bacterium]